MIWSNTGICKIFPAAVSTLVIAMSSLLSFVSPLGWLWQKIIETALSRIAFRNASLGCTGVWLTSPFVILCMFIILFVELSDATG